MKKVALVIATLLVAGQAFAHPGHRRGHHHHHHHNNGDAAAGAAVVGTSAGLLLGLSTADAAHHRLEVRMVQEDAAAFLMNGEVSPTLGQAFEIIRTSNPELADASDETLVELLLQ